MNDKADVTTGTLSQLGLLQQDAGAKIEHLLAKIKEDGIETVRFVFPDQHGVLRGKSVVADAVAPACRQGITAPSSLVLKDTSHRTVFPVWSNDVGFGERALVGAGDLLMVPLFDTYRRLPWSPHAAWVLCDIAQADGSPIPFGSRTVLTTALDKLHAKGWDMMCGLEVEFHIFRIIDQRLNHEDGGLPGAPPETAPLTHGYQLLTDNNYSVLEEVMDKLRRASEALGLPVRSMEVEFGPSQIEFTFEPARAMDHADNMVLFRTMVKQVCQRHGLHATFMCRPKVAHAAASGWHLHQSIIDRETGKNLFTPTNDDLTGLAKGWLAGLLSHAQESCLLTTPTVNGYKRYQPFQLAPDRIQWGHDNKGTMLRALMRRDDSAARIENRVAEPAANPYFFFASQILGGLSGAEQGLAPPAPAETPYDADAPRLPKSLISAIEAFEAGTLFTDNLGASFSSYLSTLKRAEWDRYLMTVSDWEHQEYASLF